MANILLVDDQPYVGELLSEELAQEGHVLTCLTDGDSLLAHLEKSTPDLILLDLYLNGFKGWDLLRDIKTGSCSCVPVVILTAYDSFPDDPRLSPADGYVVKDISTNKLRKKINEILGLRVNHQQNSMEGQGGCPSMQRKPEFLE